MDRPIERALISVSDKTGLADLAAGLQQLGIEIVSTGGTAKALRELGHAVTDISALTGFPEIMDGRVKTLHPAIHGALLAIRGAAEHEQALAQHAIAPIDLLVVNLYPFEETIAHNTDWGTAIENIDVGGPAMIRAGAKNHERVTVIVDPQDYPALLAELQAGHGATTAATRRRLAAKAFARTAAYDAVISQWFARELGETAPEWISFSGRLVQPLRYGENPHQTAALYRTSERRPGVVTATQIQGKELSYNNINDTDAALECVAEFDPNESAACVIVKHANPCGVAVAASPAGAYALALRCDPVSAFGGIVALNRELDAATAREIVKLFAEVIIAPGASEEARAIIAAKKNLRLLITQAMPEPHVQGLVVKSIAGGLLVQSRDSTPLEQAALNIVTRRAPNEREIADLIFAFKVAKHVKSNALVYAKDGATVGIGAGQMSRVDAARIATFKSAEAARSAGLTKQLTKGSVVASDAFFPFADGLIEAAEAGATAVIQPGGSVRDEEIIAAADSHRLAMAFTGIRHFRH